MNRFVVVCGLFVISLAVARPATACTCIPNPPPEEALAGADFVFAGRVLEIKSTSEEEYPVALNVTLWVERPFKGFFIETVSVRTARDSASCGFPFERDGRYIVYAHTADDGTVRVSLCSRTARLEDAGADLEAFDALDLLDEEEDKDEDGGRCGGPTNIGAMQTLVFVLLGVGWFRRRRKSNTP